MTRAQDVAQEALRINAEAESKSDWQIFWDADVYAPLRRDPQLCVR